MVSTIPTLSLLETCLYVDNVPEARTFYQQVLGLRYHSSVEGRHVFFRCGDQMFLLFSPQVSSQSREIPPHGASGPGHVAFQVQGHELDLWRKHLRAHGVEIELEHSWPSGGRSLYFRDPAGNSLELATPATWQ